MTTTTTTPLPAEAYATALVSLPAMGPTRLGALLRDASPERVWAGLTTAPGDDDVFVRLAPELRVPSRVIAEWRRTASTTDPAAVWNAVTRAGVGAAVLGSAGYPLCLAADVEPPAVLFHRGDLDRLAGPRVAIVGTRTCSRYGRDVAFELGRDLAEAGVGVVSGLALGIDGAAHAGALAVDGGPPLAVVGSGLDVVYPRAHRELWRRIESVGLVLTEAPLGAPPEAWRFPARNRVIAALADVVVVVESRERGGSMHTVAEAARRDVPVMAVPGPVRSATSAGTNRLLADGAQPVCEASDVLIALGLSPGGRRPATDARVAPEGVAADVLEAIGWQPQSLNALITATGLSPADVALALNALHAGGWVAPNGPWWERCAR